MDGETAVAIALQKKGLIAGLSITKGGQLRFNVFNSSNQVVHLTPKTIIANVWEIKLEIKYLGQDPKVFWIKKEKNL